MDEFVKSIIEHIIGSENTGEKPAEQTQAENQLIYRPNYQRGRNNQVKTGKSSLYYCIDIAQRDRKDFAADKTYTQQEDLRWVRLHAKEEQ